MSRCRLGILLILAGVLANALIDRPLVSREEWRRQLAGPVRMAPMALGTNFLLAIGTDSLVLLAEDGRETGRATFAAPLCFPPLICGTATVVVVDASGTLRGFSPQLVERWRRDLPEPPLLPLHQGGAERVLVPFRGGVLAAFALENGEPLWRCLLPGTGTITGLGGDRQAIVLVNEGSGTARISSLSGVDLSSGAILWTDRKNVGEFPLIENGMLLGCDPLGRPHLWDGETGTVRYRHPGEGLRVVGLRGERVFFLGTGGSRLDSLQFKRGGGWSSTLPQGFLRLFFGDAELLLVDRENIRCWDLSTGISRWSRSLGKVLSTQPAGDGLLVGYCDRFLAVERYLSFFVPQRSRPVWTVDEGDAVWPPVRSPRCDLLCTHQGLVRGLPRTTP